MRVIFNKAAQKDLSKLDKKIETAFYNRLRVLSEEPKNPILNIHPLKGKYFGKLSFNVTGDFRCIYYHYENDAVIIERISTHSELY